MPYFSSSLCSSLIGTPWMHFKLLSWCCSLERVNLNKSMCGFLNRNCLGLQKFLFPTKSLLSFAARSYGDLSSWLWNPGPGVLVWGWYFSLLRYFSLNFYPPHVNVGPAHPASVSLLLVWMDVAFLILWLSDSAQLDFCWFSMVVVLWFGCNLMWLCEEVSLVYVCRHLDWELPGM